MKLYTTDKAPNPRRVRMFMAEKGIEIPMVEISIMGGEHKKDDYKKVSPLSQVPALELDDGRCITESVAICRYLEGLHPEPPLFGRDAYEQGIVEMWDRRMELLLMLPVAMTFRHTHPAMKALETQIPEWGKLSAERAGKIIRWLEGQLEGKEFIAGDFFSVADITGATALDFGHLARISVPEECKNITAWRKRIAARPSAKLGWM